MASVLGVTGIILWVVAFFVALSMPYNFAGILAWVLCLLGSILIHGANYIERLEKTINPADDSSEAKE